jgi:hypothetical protein
MASNTPIARANIGSPGKKIFLTEQIVRLCQQVKAMTLLLSVKAGLQSGEMIVTQTADYHE